MLSMKQKLPALIHSLAEREVSIVEAEVKDMLSGKPCAHASRCMLRCSLHLLVGTQQVAGYSRCRRLQPLPHQRHCSACFLVHPTCSASSTFIATIR